MKIYTRGGDDGTTGLFGGGRTRKDDRRIEAVGGLDELNASLGWAAAAVPAQLQQMSRRVQGELFEIGAHLSASDATAAVKLPVLKMEMISRLEREIDQTEAQLPPLRQFILPGASEASARLHLARAVCRRAERAVVHLSEQSPVDATARAYLNRLSDWLFVLARWCNREAGIEDVPWTGG